MSEGPPQCAVVKLLFSNSVLERAFSPVGSGVAALQTDGPQAFSETWIHGMF